MLTPEQTAIKRMMVLANSQHRRAIIGADHDPPDFQIVSLDQDVARLSRGISLRCRLTSSMSNRRLKPTVERYRGGKSKVLIATSSLEQHGSESAGHRQRPCAKLIQALASVELGTGFYVVKPVDRAGMKIFPALRKPQGHGGETDQNRRPGSRTASSGTTRAGHWSATGYWLWPPRSHWGACQRRSGW